MKLGPRERLFGCEFQRSGAPPTRPEAARPAPAAAAPSDARPCATPGPRRQAPGSSRTGWARRGCRRPAARVHPLQLLLRYSETQPNQLRPENLILEPQAREPRRLVKLSQRLRSPFHAWKFGHLGHLEHARILPRPLAMSRSSRAIKPVVKKPARKTRQTRRRTRRARAYPPCRDIEQASLPKA